MKRKGCVVIAILIVAIAGFALYTYNRYNNAVAQKDTSSNEKVLITIDQGESPASVRDKLVNAGVIKDEDIGFGYTAYKIYAFMTKFDTKIQAGSYQLTKGTSIQEIAQQLQRADSAETKVTLKEGLRIEEIADEINRVLNTSENKKSKFNKNEFISLAKSYNSDREFLSLRPAGVKSLEGYLFPDTYFISQDATATDMVHLMLENFDTKIYKPNLGSIKNNKYSLHELLTVASILQREVQTKDDMSKVADIFYRRNSEGMKLEADSTVQYAIGYSNEEGVWWKKDLTVTDLNVSNPYNTRKYQGIPPGPIDSMGADAFSAALEPQANEYYYYISDKDGVTRFARTLAEHEANKRKYGLAF